MFNLSENYHLRKCLLKRDQVPTLSLMKKTMSPALAEIYFKSMSPKLKVVAGLEPQLKGGGSNWYMPPGNILKGRAVLKPIDTKLLEKLSYNGVDEVGIKLAETYRIRMKEEKESILRENDRHWQNKINIQSATEWERCCTAAEEVNTIEINRISQQFGVLYSKSINKIQDVMFDAAVIKIKKYQEKARRKMKAHYKQLLRQQVGMLNDRYEEKLKKKKAFLKKEFIENLEVHRTEFCYNFHDINVDKHVAIEKLRHYVECQNLACQVYVALIERAEAAKEKHSKELEYKKKLQTSTNRILYTAFEISIATEKEKHKKEINTIWKKKVCHVVKTFQTFVLYCLKMLPDQADFFINMEKLFLLQLSKALENPTVDSIIEKDYNTPVAKPHPFYLFCDKGSHKSVDSKLCPKHATSSASQMPVIVVNKRCIYAACDNFEQFPDQIKKYIHGGLDDIVDDHDYTRNLNVTYTASQQLRELKLESSLQQVLQREIANLYELPIECGLCKMQFCFCKNDSFSSIILYNSPASDSSSMIKETKASVLSTHAVGLEHEMTPKWDHYLKYVEPKRCRCPKIAKKNLIEHLPPYMRNMSTYEPPELLKYQKCSTSTLKVLVKKAQGRIDPIPLRKVVSKTRNIATQCSDTEYDELCNCLSDMSLIRFLEHIGSYNDITNINQHFRVQDGSLSPSYLTKQVRSFAADRAMSLRRLLDQFADVVEIFEKEKCTFDL